MQVNIVAPPAPATDDAAMRAVLRDGSIAMLKIADAGDCGAIRRFFHDLSPESRRKRFFTVAEPSDDLIERLCDATDLARGATLVARRVVEGDARPIAVGSYSRTGPGLAEAAFAVDDRFQGRGLGTILLEQLAALAVAHGFRRFEATTLPENAAMLEVFRESGFEIRSKTQHGTIDVQLSLDPTSATVAAAERRLASAAARSLRPPLEPASVAVIGASRDPASIGHRMLNALVDAGFSGPVYPINPKATDLEGLR
jgi:RimJ/RimL family protein N-acetyltransferase